MKTYPKFENEGFVDFGISNSQDIPSFLEAELYHLSVPWTLSRVLTGERPSQCEILPTKKGYKMGAVFTSVDVGGCFRKGRHVR